MPAITENGNHVLAEVAKPSQAGGPGAVKCRSVITNANTEYAYDDFGVPNRLYSVESPPSVQQLEDICKMTRDSSTFGRYPLAKAIDADIPIYDALSLSLPGMLLSDAKQAQLQNEWHEVLLNGPGVFILKNMYPPSSHANTIDSANVAFNAIIEREQAGNSAKGDHFATGERNARVWNSFSKHALADPASFVSYYSNRWLALVSEAWLGPSYRLTAQLNVVRPGGAPQVAHRDYHLGFQSAEACERFPIAMQVASQLLTLQGAVAHSDMPTASGPTRFLPFSQKLKEGYMAYRLPEFVEYFDANWVSLPLGKGDGVFFNPALFHAAGHNQSEDVERSANLIQVSSAFGKSMESVDTIPIVECCWPFLVDMHEQEVLRPEVEAAVAAIGEGYPFPTNLDRRPPALGGMAPEDEQALLRRCLVGKRHITYVLEALHKMRSDSQA